MGGPDLKIGVGPNAIKGLNADFIDDTILEVVRPAYYKRAYKIDRYPNRDTSGWVMILNGTTFIRED